MARIAIYAGHGGSDLGAVSGKFREEDITLSISNAITAILRGWGYEVINNRVTNVDRSIINDAQKANDSNIDGLVEIHMNSNDGKPGSGAEAFISINDKGRARKLAAAILKHLEKIDYKNRGIMTSVTPLGSDSFGIIRLVNAPAVLLELAFINNPEEMAHFDILQEATAIAEGIKEAIPIGGEDIIGALPAYPGGILQQGATGEEVQQLKYCLNRVLFTGDSNMKLVEDGEFCSGTKAAVMVFQKLVELPVDGLVDIYTWQELSKKSM